MCVVYNEPEYNTVGITPYHYQWLLENNNYGSCMWYVRHLLERSNEAWSDKCSSLTANSNVISLKTALCDTWNVLINNTKVIHRNY